MRQTITAALLACLLLIPTLASAEEQSTSSAHVQALHLVLSTQAGELQRLDADDESIEAAPRTWAVFRPEGSGELDRHYTFTVNLSISGRVVASWYVNIGEGTVEPQPFTSNPELP